MRRKEKKKKVEKESMQANGMQPASTSKGVSSNIWCVLVWVVVVLGGGGGVCLGGFLLVWAPTPRGRWEGKKKSGTAKKEEIVSQEWGQTGALQARRRCDKEGRGKKKTVLTADGAGDLRKLF